MKTRVYVHRFRVSNLKEEQSDIVHVVDEISFIHVAGKVKLLYPADYTYIYGLGEDFIGEYV